MTSVGDAGGNRRTKTLAYSVSACQKSARELGKLLKDTFAKLKYRDEPRYIPFSMKWEGKHGKELFQSFVKYQNSYCKDLHTVAVESIPREIMSRDKFDAELKRKYSEIVDIYDHIHTDAAHEKGSNKGNTIGRWNIMVKRRDFETVANAMERTLAVTYHAFVKTNKLKQIITGMIFDPEVTSNYRARDDMSDSNYSRNSWSSCVNTCYTNSSIATYIIEDEEDPVAGNYDLTMPSAFGAPIVALVVGNNVKRSAQTVNQTVGSSRKNTWHNPPTKQVEPGLAEERDAERSANIEEIVSTLMKELEATKAELAEIKYAATVSATAAAAAAAAAAAQNAPQPNQCQPRVTQKDIQTMMEQLQTMMQAVQQ